MTKTQTQKIEDPYEAGWLASADMKDESANPYPRGTDAFQNWLEGWREGESDWQELCQNEVAAGRPHPDA